MNIQASLAPAFPVSLIPEVLRNIPAVELVALLGLRNTPHAKTCAGYLAESESTIAVTAEHRFMLVTLGLAKGRADSCALTMRGRMASELLIRHIAPVVGLHIIVLGLTETRMGFAKCTCGWVASQPGKWAITRPFLEGAGANHVLDAADRLLERVET